MLTGLEPRRHFLQPVQAGHLYGASCIWSVPRVHMSKRNCCVFLEFSVSFSVSVGTRSWESNSTVSSFNVRVVLAMRQLHKNPASLGVPYLYCEWLGLAAGSPPLLAPP